MRILLINQFPLVGSGSGVYVTNIAKSLKQRGHEVCIIMPENTTNIIDVDGVKIHPVFFKREEVIEGQLDFNFPCMDPHPRSNFLFNNMNDMQIRQYESAFRSAIEEELGSFKPDVIHSQHIWIISGLLKDYDVPYMVTSHGAEFITYKKTDVFDNYGKNAIDGCKKLITISDDNRKEILDKFPEVEDRMVFLKNAYNSNDFFIEDLDRKEILKKFSVEGDFEKIVMFVGRISEMKGLDILIKAAKMYETDKVLTLIVGDGEYCKQLNVLKNNLGLKNIVFLGSKNHRELRLLYNISDVFVLPSRKEALPLVAIEALACGLPAVVTDLPGMDTIITKDVGLLFDMNDERMLAEKVKMVLENKVKFDKDKLSEYAKNNYSQDIFMDKLISMYEEIREK